MSIEVAGVSKLYGDQKALNNVSFHIPSGQIVGFLGPNGAGKSTMMKIITCYIPQSQGSVKVKGHDVASEPLEVKKVVGYLPEHNPLYLDMYVREFLEFAAGMNGAPKSRVEEMIALTGLTKEAHKPISALSKGYRQRVGLAQALIHDPEVLILDEPTTGLDPNQIVEIRELIRNIGKEKTVMLSTHIMQEVEAICDRVIIIDKGTIAADKPTEELRSQKSSSRQVIQLEFSGKLHKKKFAEAVGAEQIKEVKPTLWIIESRSGKDMRPAIFQHAVDNGWTLLSVGQKEQTLEEVFRDLTKR